ncbi:MAG TPA: hypothetical protein V6C72_04685, partial [Chroococcales cyanobacterium]
MISLSQVREGVNKLIDEKIVSDSLFGVYMEESGIKKLTGRKIPAERADALRDQYQRYTFWVSENPEWVKKQLANRLKDPAFNAHKKEDAWLATARAARAKEGVTKENLRSVLDNVYIIDKAIAKPALDSPLYKENTGSIHARKAAVKYPKHVEATSIVEAEVAHEPHLISAPSKAIQAPKEKKVEARIIPVSAVRNEDGKVILASAEDLLQKAEAEEENRRAELAAQSAAAEEMQKQEVPKSVHILGDEKAPIDLATKGRNSELDKFVARVDDGKVEIVAREALDQTDVPNDGPKSVSFLGRAITGAATLAAVGGAIIIPTTEAAAVPSPTSSPDAQPNATASQDPSAAPAPSASASPKPSSSPSEVPTSLPSASTSPEAASTPSPSESHAAASDPKPSETTSETPSTNSDTSSESDASDQQILNVVAAGIPKAVHDGRLNEIQGEALTKEAIDTGVALAQNPNDSTAVPNLVQEFLNDEAANSTTTSHAPTVPEAHNSTSTTNEPKAATTPSVVENSAATTHESAPKAVPTITLQDPLAALAKVNPHTTSLSARANLLLGALADNTKTLETKGFPHADPSAIETDDVAANLQANQNYLGSVATNPDKLSPVGHGIAAAPPVYGYDVQSIIKQELPKIKAAFPEYSDEQALQMATLAANQYALQLWSKTAITEGGTAAYASVAPAFKKAQEAAKAAGPSAAPHAPAHTSTTPAAHETTPTASGAAHDTTPTASDPVAQAAKTAAAKYGGAVSASILEDLHAHFQKVQPHNQMGLSPDIIAKYKAATHVVDVDPNNVNDAMDVAAWVLNDQVKHRDVPTIPGVSTQVAQEVAYKDGTANMAEALRKPASDPEHVRLTNMITAMSAINKLRSGGNSSAPAATTQPTKPAAPAAPAGPVQHTQAPTPQSQSIVPGNLPPGAVHLPYVKKPGQPDPTPQKLPYDHKPGQIPPKPVPATAPSKPSVHAQTPIKVQPPAPAAKQAAP